jgi:hypothetical protein
MQMILLSFSAIFLSEDPLIVPDLPEIKQRSSHAEGRWLQRLAHYIPVREKRLLVHTSTLSKTAGKGQQRQISRLIQSFVAYCLAEFLCI